MIVSCRLSTINCGISSICNVGRLSMGASPLSAILLRCSVCSIVCYLFTLIDFAANRLDSQNHAIASLRSPTIDVFTSGQCPQRWGSLFRLVNPLTHQLSSIKWIVCCLYFCGPNWVISLVNGRHHFHCAGKILQLLEQWSFCLLDLFRLQIKRRALEFQLKAFTQASVTSSWTVCSNYRKRADADISKRAETTRASFPPIRSRSSRIHDSGRVSA